jgi:hypothetical protein
MTHITLPLKLKVRAMSLWQAEDFSMKRVALWTLVFTDAFFVGALLGRALSVIR